MKKYRVVSIDIKASTERRVLKRTDNIETAISCIRSLTYMFLNEHHWVIERLSGDVYEYYVGWNEETGGYLDCYGLNI